MKLLSIHVGRPKQVAWQGKDVETSIWKSAVKGPVAVRQHNIDGDQQADLRFHGGQDKAVYAYAGDAYEWWRAEWKDPKLSYGVFGENLVFSALDESAIASGDVFELGTCVLRAREPRFPCANLGIRFGDMKVLKTFFASKRSGVYFAVDREGEIREGDELKLVKAVTKDRVTIAEIFAAKPRPPAGLLEKIAASTTVMPFWRDWAAKKLEG